MADNDRLRETAENLHEMLAGTTSLDPPTRDELKRVSEEIQQVLQADTATQEQAKSLREQLQSLLLRLETEHPNLTGILSQIDDLLAGIGI